MEKILLTKLEWQVTSITGHVYVHHMCEALANAGGDALFLRAHILPEAELFMESAACIYDFSCFRPSTLAVAAMVSVKDAYANTHTHTHIVTQLFCSFPTFRLVLLPKMAAHAGLKCTSCATALVKTRTSAHALK